MSKGFELKRYLIIALMTAVICILSPISITIPISPVPISLATLGIYLTIYILGGKDGAISTMIFILLGLVGAPVFTGYSGGVGKVLGPTGGYIVAYIFLAIIAGYIIEKNYDSFFICLLGMGLGTVVLYLVGTLWLKVLTEMTFNQALLVGVIPFIPGDIVKMIIALIIGKRLRQILIRAGYIS